MKCRHNISEYFFLCKNEKNRKHDLLISQGCNYDQNQFACCVNHVISNMSEQQKQYGISSSNELQLICLVCYDDVKE